jgi:hypothetical protein
LIQPASRRRILMIREGWGANGSLLFRSPSLNNSTNENAPPGGEALRYVTRWQNGYALGPRKLRDAGSIPALVSGAVPLIAGGGAAPTF